MTMGKGGYCKSELQKKSKESVFSNTAAFVIDLIVPAVPLLPKKYMLLQA